MLVDILGEGGLCSLGFDIAVGKLTARQALMLNKTQEELPSESDITGADDIEPQEIAEKATKSMEDLISHLNDQQSQTDDLLEYPLRELLGLDKQLRSIRGSLKVEVARRLSQKNKSLKSIESLRNSQSTLENTMMQ